jgi:hypothetical protein
MMENTLIEDLCNTEPRDSISVANICVDHGMFPSNTSLWAVYNSCNRETAEATEAMAANYENRYIENIYELVQNADTLAMYKEFNESSPETIIFLNELAHINPFVALAALSLLTKKEVTDEQEKSIEVLKDIIRHLASGRKDLAKATDTIKMKLVRDSISTIDDRDQATNYANALITAFDREVAASIMETAILATHICAEEVTLKTPVTYSDARGIKIELTDVLTYSVDLENFWNRAVEGTSNIYFWKHSERSKSGAVLDAIFFSGNGRPLIFIRPIGNKKGQARFIISDEDGLSFRIDHDESHGSTFDFGTTDGIEERANKKQKSPTESKRWVNYRIVSTKLAQGIMHTAGRVFCTETYGTPTDSKYHMHHSRLFVGDIEIGEPAEKRFRNAMFRLIDALKPENSTIEQRKLIDWYRKQETDSN